ncbi:hypothetical protein TYRP_019116, partial [Tyrophagus putrescentiae]
GSSPSTQHSAERVFIPPKLVVQPFTTFTRSPQRPELDQKEKSGALYIKHGDSMEQLRTPAAAPAPAKLVDGNRLISFFAFPLLPVLC